MQTITIVDMLSKSIEGPLAAVYTIYATTFAALGVVIAFAQIYRNTPTVYKYKIGSIWSIKASVFLAVTSIIALQITSLLIVVLNIEKSCTFYCMLKVFLVLSCFSFLMLGAIYYLVLRIASQVVNILENKTI